MNRQRNERERFEFPYENEDGQDGFVKVRLAGPIHYDSINVTHDMPLMVQFDDAPWMGEDDARRFARWLDRLVRPKRWWEFWK